MNWLPFSDDPRTYDYDRERELEDEYAALYGHEGLTHPDVRDRSFDERMAARDRLEEKGPLAHAFRPALDELDEAA